jgi:hypothetical protein
MYFVPLVQRVAFFMYSLDLWQTTQSAHKILYSVLSTVLTSG